MKHSIGIRHEDKSTWERRAPLTPEHVAALVAEHGIDFVVEPSPQRAFSEDAYRAAGARISSDLSSCRVVLGVKEIPLEKLHPRTTYVNFSHVIKGQPYNMPTLQKLLALECTLIDYEKVRDDHGHRLIHFGRFAGLAGTIDMIWALGRRLEWEGIGSPFEEILPAHRYPSLAAAKDALREAGARIRREGLPEALRPLVFGITGRGNVSGGAHEILDCLPVHRVDPEGLPALAGPGGDGKHVHTVTFANRHFVEPRDEGASFDKAEYRAHPERYRPTFHRFLPFLTAIVNGIYWDQRYPRLIAREDLTSLYGGGETARLRVVADITADIGGAIEATVKPTDPDEPTYVYDPRTGRVRDGWTGPGLVVLAVDFLPTELPVEASASFADRLAPFVPSLATAAFDGPVEAIGLAPELARAVIAHGGALAPDFAYIAGHF